MGLVVAAVVDIEVGLAAGVGDADRAGDAGEGARGACTLAADVPPDRAAAAAVDRQRASAWPATLTVSLPAPSLTVKAAPEAVLLML